MNDDQGQVHQESMVRFERLLPGPAERVWQFLTESQHLAGWFAGDAKVYQIEPREGGAVDLLDGHIRGVVTQWKPPRRLTYTWNVYHPGQTDSDYPESYLSFDLAPQGDEVLLTLTHRPVVKRFEKQTMMGWHTFLAMLTALVEGRTPESRAVLMERHRVHYGIDQIEH